MAFIRGVYEGLDIGALADQYLGNLGDRRRARSTLRWLVDELANAARKRGDSAGARLLRLPTAKLIDSLSDPEVGLPSNRAAVTSTVQNAEDRSAIPRPFDRGPVATAFQPPGTAASLIARSELSPPSGAAELASTEQVEAAFDSVEAFRDRHDPDGVYSEAELIALYEDAQADAHRAAPAQRASTGDAAHVVARHGASENGTEEETALHAEDRLRLAAHTAHTARAARVRARNQRLRTRRREVLDRLEATLVEPPRLHHFIGDWIDPALAARLEAVDINTVADLLSLINRRGFHWYRDVPRVGRRAAERLRDWLAMNAGDLGAQIARHAASPRRQWSASVAAARRVTSEHLAALEYFTPEDDRIAADRDLILQMLARYKPVASTYRAFRLQAERLLLWAALHRQVAVQNLSDQDVQAYFAFMQAPDADWCGPKVERGLPTWRPFEGPASDASVRIARRALKALFAPLVAAGTVRRNPFESRVPFPSVAIAVAQAVPYDGQATAKHSKGRPLLAIHLARMRLLARVREVSKCRLSEIAELTLSQFDALLSLRSATSPTLAPGGKHTFNEALREARAAYLALREVEQGPVDPESPLFVRHTATGLDLSAPRATLPADTLARVFARYQALCRRNPDVA
ncbi:phage integrase family protein [Robbsia sp. KACC 23696]|uniref:phage integrase family protein n=1 Tax=Robbsia sp. KACC 23696 TaxID=3149231 RepID=UPI00325B5F53